MLTGLETPAFPFVEAVAMRLSGDTTSAPSLIAENIVEIEKDMTQNTATIYTERSFHRFANRRNLITFLYR